MNSCKSHRTLYINGENPLSVAANLTISYGNKDQGAFHTCTVESRLAELAEAINVPSGDQATEDTSPVCPR